MSFYQEDNQFEFSNLSRITFLPGLSKIHRVGKGVIWNLVFPETVHWMSHDDCYGLNCVSLPPNFMVWSEPPEPQNVTLFGNRVIADVIRSITMLSYYTSGPYLI